LSTATRPSPARGLWAVPIVLAVVLLVALFATLAHSQPALTGTNSVPLRGPAVGIRHGQTLCQPGQVLPEGSGRMRMFLAPAKQDRTPEVNVTIRTGEDGVVANTTGRYKPPGVLDVPIRPAVKHTRLDGLVCITNTGRGTVVMSGILTPFGNVQLAGKKLDVSLTTLWYAPDDQSWFSRLGAIIPRVGHARVGGVWAFWAASLLLLTALSLSLVTAIRVNTR
jgi:hypothetical protein